jgi:Tfp pilus assembly protein PilN
MDLFLKCLTVLFGFVSVCAALYNLLTVHRRAKERDEANRQTAQLEATTALAIRTQERVNALESRLGSFEQRVEKRLDQIAEDLGDFKEMFTNFLITLKK